MKLTSKLFGGRIIEMLLADLFARMIKDFSAKAAKAQTSIELKVLNDKLIEQTREKDRMSRVLNANKSPDTNEAFEDLHNSREALLASLCASDSKTHERSKNVETALYSIRNRVFHSYSKVSHLGIEIEDIANRLFLLLCELTVAYKLPNPSHC